MQTRIRSVRHYGPGGRENGGGIGRLIGYIVDAATHRGQLHLVRDTRGPAVNILSPIVFLETLATMAADRLTAPERLHHIHVAGRGSTARKLVLTAWARCLGCRHILHLHDYDYAADLARRPGWLAAAIGRMFRGADRVLVLGERDRDTVLRILGADPARTVILRNCVPDPGPAASHNETEIPRILFLGRLSARKGVPELLAALADPRMASIAWRATLAGDGPVGEYRAQAEALGLLDRVSFPGWCDTQATAALCREANVLVLPSHAEGMAMAVLEGLAHGLAVVTTPVGAHGEVLSDGVTARLVPPGDAAALAAALHDLLKDAAARHVIARQGRALFQHRFAIDPYLDRLETIYDGISAPQHQFRSAE